MMLLTRVFMMIMIAVFSFVALGAASDDIYRFQDEDGVWHFSNDLSKVTSDRRYRLYLKYHNNPGAYIDDYKSTIKKASETYGVESSLIKAVIMAESGGNHNTTSSKGAQGFMQLMPYTADYLSVDERDPEENILGGTRYLSMMLERFKKNIKLALAAYNAGPEKVEAYNGVPPYQETKTYIKRVLSYYSKFKSEAE
jgi:soluble lytic murein transglycosylase-like protein